MEFHRTLLKFTGNEAKPKNRIQTAEVVSNHFNSPFVKSGYFWAIMAVSRVTGPGPKHRNNQITLAHC